MPVISRRASLGVFAAAMLPLSVLAQDADPAVAQIRAFYDALTASMKQGGGLKARYDTFKPAVEKAFDLPGMTAIAVGTTWSSVPPADQKALIDAFTRMTVANYVKSFDSYGGEKFTVDPMPVVRGAEKLVKSTLQPGKGDPIAFNYRMHDAGGAWKVTDIYLAGNISQMAQKRSDFAATLTSSGPQGLAKRLNALADQMLG